MRQRSTRPSLAGPVSEAELWSIVYRELKILARAVLRGRRRLGGPQTTTLVHEAYLRLADARSADFNDRRHFYAVAARAMRFVLADDSRQRLAGKRGSGRPEVDVSGDLVETLGDPVERRAEETIAVHEALDRLGEISPRQVKLVELRYFCGFSVEETAELLGVSRATVLREWKAVRVWLHGLLSEPAGKR